MTKLISKIKYELSVFMILAVAGIIALRESGYTDSLATMYLPDFSLGFCTRFIIGAIINVFDKTLTERGIHILWITVLIVIWLLFSLLVGKFLRSLPEDLKKPCCLFLFLALTGTLSMEALASGLGFLDTYWVLSAIIALFCLQKKLTKYLLPLICIFACMVHPVFVLTFFPMLAGVMLWKCIGRREKGDVAILLVSIAVVGAMSVYAVFFESKTLTLPYEEFNAYLHSKYDGMVLEKYFSYYLYGVGDFGDINPSSQSTMVVSFIFTLFNSMKQLNPYTPFTLFLFLLAAPIFALYFSVWVGAFRADTQRSHRVFYLLCMLASLASVVCSMISTDVARFVSWSLLTQTGLLFSLVQLGCEPVRERLINVGGFLLRHKECTAIIFAFYSTMFMEWI